MFEPDAPIEYAMTQTLGSEGSWRAVARPAAVVGTARRMCAWRSSPEFCTACGKPATAIANVTAFCAACRFERQHRAEASQPWRGRTPAAHAVRATDQPMIVGHPIVIDSRSVDLGGFFEFIRAEALDRTIHEQPDLRALWNHNPDVPLGRSTGGTLAYWKDARGLAISVQSPRSAASVVEAIELRTVTGGSFAFRTIDDAWHLEDEIPIREVLDMRVIEVSPVAFPAYPATDMHIEQSGQHSRAWWERQHQQRLASADVVR